MITNSEPHECVIFVKSTKIGTHENKAVHRSEEHTHEVPIESAR